MKSGFLNTIKKAVDKNHSLLNNNKTGSSSETITETLMLDLITNHPCFTELAMWGSTKLNNLDIPKPARREMTKAFIKIIVDTCADHTVKFQSFSMAEMEYLFKNSNLSNRVSEIFDEINKNAALASIPPIFLDENKKVTHTYINAVETTITDIHLYRYGRLTDACTIFTSLDILYAVLRLMWLNIPNMVNSMGDDLDLALVGTKFDPS